jgi:hypothetical protein
MVTVDTCTVKTAAAVAPVPPPPVKLTVGADVYPLPPAVMVTDVTRPFATVAVAAAPLPPPLVNTTVGALVYPLPPADTVTVATEVDAIPMT